MKKKLRGQLILPMLMLAALVPCQAKAQSFPAFIGYLEGLPAEDRMAAVDSFMNVIAPAGFPYINGDTAHFIYRGVAATVHAAGDFNGWEFNPDPLGDVESTDLWYRSKIFEMNARLDYKFVINTSNWILDPLNPNTVSGGFGPNSELAMPEYVQPWEIETYPGTQQGTIVVESIHSDLLNKTYQLKIYLPHDYNENRPQGYPAVYYQDGYEYISLGSADRVMDNLIDSGLMCPAIGVFVRPTNRNEEYAGSLREAYRLFFVTELVPYIDGKYNTIAHPLARAVVGDSFGGNISALIAYSHPDVFANCGLHSGAFWPNDYEAYDLIVNGEKEDIRWASVWGTYEGLWQNMRDFRDFLLEQEYPLHWLELPEGHSWGQWRATIDEIVPYFFPPEFMGVEEPSPISGEIRASVSPNPCRDRCEVYFLSPGPGTWQLFIFDPAGKLVVELTGQTTGGISRIPLDLGRLTDSLYCYSLLQGNRHAAGKILIY
jgi:enterochelin esterase family protein